MSDEAEIRNLLESRARCIHDKQAEATLRFYAEDIVNFDLAPPLAIRGAAAIDPGELRQWFDTWDGPIGLAFDQLQIRTADDLGSRSASCISPAGGRTVPRPMPGRG